MLDQKYFFEFQTNLETRSEELAKNQADSRVTIDHLKKNISSVFKQSFFANQAYENFRIDVEDKLLKNENATQELESRLNGTSSTVQSLKNSVKGLTGSLNTVKDNISDLQTRNQELAKQQDFNKDLISSIKKNISALYKENFFDQQKLSTTQVP